MKALLFILVIHGMAAVGLLIFSWKHGMSSGSIKGWGLSGATFGMAAYGPFAWSTRDD